MVRHSPQRQSLLLKIAARLLHQAELAGLGQVFHAPCNIRLGRNVAVQPDIFFVQDFRRGIIGEDQIYGIPDLAVELQTDASPSAEHIERRRIYLRFGVPELWLIDTSRHAVEAFLWSEIGYIPSGASQEPGCLRSALFPELHFSLAGLF
jgi:Uma2 family endonuclease